MSTMRTGWPWVVAAVALGAALLWLSVPAPRQAGDPVASTPRASLTSGVVASMDSPAFRYTPGWQVGPRGADPTEPVDPWSEPSGAVEFEYTGSELALSLAPGDYWGYLFVTVDGEPANLLATIQGNLDSHGQPAGYRTLVAPERLSADSSMADWVRVHRSPDGPGPHQARIEVWRSWGQAPLRGVAVDGLPADPHADWPAALLLLIAGGCSVYALAARPPHTLTRPWLAVQAWVQHLRPALQPAWATRHAGLLAGTGLFLVGLGAGLQAWPLSVFGVGLLGVGALQRLALWPAALLFALPFYFAWPLPILPGRALNLVDVGVLGGSALLLVHWLLAERVSTSDRSTRILLGLLILIAAWGLVSAFAAANREVALREWRTVFLYAVLFAFLVVGTLRVSASPRDDRWLMVGAWLAGATVVALIALWQYAGGAMIVTAEGVTRVRAFYGSPNNLALYLERTLAVTLGLALFIPGFRARLVWGAAAGLQGLALLFTFSKGSIFLALPVLLLALWTGGYVVLRRQDRPRRVLWVVAAAAGLALLILVPFLGTERFASIVDLSQGTGFLRLQLWRSAWQMALDHPLLGVGPDNFLYTYRSIYLLPAAWQEPNLNHPHNWPLDWWTRLGLPGLMLGIAFWGVGLGSLWQTVRQPRPQVAEAALSVGLLAAAMAALVHGLIDASYALPDLMLVWVFMFTIQSTSQPINQSTSQPVDWLIG